MNKAIRPNLNNANNYNNRGVAYKRKGDYGRAIQDLNSNDTIAYFNRGDCYFAQRVITGYTAALAELKRLDASAVPAK